MAFDVNSVPWSETIICGLPRVSISVVSSRATRRPESELVVDEVERPAGIDPRLDQDRGAASNGPPPGPALANRQPFLPVKPVDAIDARRLAFPSQQDEQPPVAKPAALI